MPVYYSIKDFNNISEEYSDDVIQDICPIGVTLLFASQKSGKSLFARSIAKAICEQKEKFLDFQINTKGNVIYFALDDSNKTLHERFDSFKTLNNFFLVTKSCLNEARELSSLFTKVGYFCTIIDQIVRNHGYVSLVIVDTFEKIRNANSMRDYAREVEEVSLLKEKAEQHGFNLLLVHHATKFSKGNPLQNFYGSNGIGAECDVIMTILETTDKNIQSLIISGNNIEQAEILISKDKSLNYFKENFNREDLIQDKPEKSYIQIIKYFTAKSNHSENKKYSWSGEYQDLITELDLDVDPSGLGKVLKDYKNKLIQSHITFEIKRRKTGQFLKINIDRNE